MTPIATAWASTCALMARGRSEAGGEFGDGLERAAVAVGLQEVRRLRPEPDAAAIAHDGIEVGAELTAALQGGDERLAAQVLPRRLQHCADHLRQAPLGQPDVVALLPVVLLVRLLVVGVELVDDVELRERRKEL